MNEPDSIKPAAAGYSVTNADRICSPEIPRGTVVIAATPIGNASDASDRLKTLLENADTVAAEDTRRVFDLARRLGIRINGKVVANHDHNEREKADALLDRVAEGQTVVVVSDAGMPVINDPGLAVVRRAIERELPVTCAPGPSAVLDALALSGLATDRFCYEGFVPRKNSERIKRFRSLLYEPRTMIFFETPHRIEQTMTALAEIFPTNRSMALCRELTKNYEQIRRGTISGIKQSVEEDPPRGEIVLVIAGAEKVADWDAESKADKVPEIPRRDETSETFETVGEQFPENSILNVEQLAKLAAQRAKAENIRIKKAVSLVVSEHPYPDGSLADRKKIYQIASELK